MLVLTARFQDRSRHLSPTSGGNGGSVFLRLHGLCHGALECLVEEF